MALVDQDRGPGDVQMFPAEDLERLYHMGGLDIAARIRGNALNQMLNVKTYDAKSWYIVTQKGVEKL